MLVTDFKEKARLFNEFCLALKSTLITNDRSLPSLLNLKLTFNLYAINFTNDDIFKIIRSFNINKAHGHDDISVAIIKICDKAILEPLSIIYKNCIDTGIFSDSWKKSNIVPLHGKGDKQLLENHRPVSLLAVLGKVFEKTLFNNIFEYLQI